MSKPFKKSGFAQSLYSQSATQKEEVGTLRICQDGTFWRYAQAGASALGHAKLCQATDIAAGILDENGSVIHAIGDQMVAETITAGVAYAENYFAGGYLHINDATGEGYSYRIVGSTAVPTTAATAITLSLDRGIVLATAVTTSQFTLVPSPWRYTVETTSATHLVVGVTPIEVTALYYYWAQTHGPAIVLSADTTAIGNRVMQSGTAGASTVTSGEVQCIGIAFGSTSVSGEYRPVFLTID